MTEFVNWNNLLSDGGALVCVTALTSFTKDLPGVNRIPTQAWSYLLSFLVLIAANAFTAGLSADIFAQTMFNSVFVSLAANGSHSALTRQGKAAAGKAAETKKIGKAGEDINE